MTKFQRITNLYTATVQGVTDTPDGWTDFLQTACRNYKCSFDEQILIHAQRPDATAVLEIERWNRRFGRWVNRGAKGIAVLDTAQPGTTRLKHYFDISDTYQRIPNARPVPVWQMESRFVDEVIETLENSFGELDSTATLPDALMSAAKNIVDDNYTDYLHELSQIREGSSLERFGELELSAEYRAMLRDSVTYMLLARCGIDPLDYLEIEEFQSVVEFNTPQTINALGIATSDIAESCLREISATVQDLENRTVEEPARITDNKPKATERGDTDEPDLSARGRLSSPEPDPASGRTRNLGQIRPTTPPLFAEPQAHPVHEPENDLYSEPAPSGDRADSDGAGGAIDQPDGDTGGRDGADESPRSDAVGGPDEQHPAESGGIGDAGDRLRLKPLPTVYEQLSLLGEAEDEISSAFSVSQAEIDRDLIRGNSFSGGKLRIYAFFTENHTTKEKADFLKEEYGIGGYAVSGFWQSHDSKGIVYSRGAPSDDPGKVVLTWSKVAKRIDELIAAGRYVTQAELDALLPAENTSKESQPHTIQSGNRYEMDGRTFEVVRYSEGGSYADLQEIDPVGFPLGRSESVEHLQTLVPLPPLPAVEAEREEPISVVASLPEEQEPPAEKEPPTPAPDLHNYRITDDTLGHGGAKTKFQANMAAIRTLQHIESENRHATPEEQDVLAQYVGWGGLPQAFDPDNASWADEHLKLNALLSPEEFASARESTLNAHYTSPTVIKAIYKAVENMGFRSGNILEPSCGVGNFLGLLPESMGASRLFGVELDSVSGRIAKRLYPNADIQITGFEETTTPDNFFDLAIGNVPFGGYKLSEKRYDKHNFNVHDHFFAKALDKVRPGGIVAFVTSKGTLDKQNPAVRKYLAQRAELVGAIRLPNTAFRANAGTEVTSDIIFLQKRDRIIDVEPDWVHLGQTKNGIPINSYFAENPDMVLGTMSTESGSRMYGSDSSAVCIPFPDSNLEEQLEVAITGIHANITEYERDEDDLEEDKSIPADPTVRNFSYTLVDDTIYYREDSRMVPVDVPVTTGNRIRGLIELRECVRNLINLQTDGYADHEIAAEQERHNTLYDSYTKQYGLLHSRGNSIAFSQDSAYALLCSLEVLDEHGELQSKAAMFTKRTIRPRLEITHVDTASEALMVSLAEKARVDLPFMAGLTGMSEDEVISKLEGVIFQDPSDDRYVTADEYLSGNVRSKLRLAKGAAEIDPKYAGNITALESVLPKDLTAAEISVRLGATWLPKDIVEEFMFDLLQTPVYAQRNIAVHYTEITGEWGITGKNADRSNIHNFNTYGTQRINAYQIIENSLNLRDVRIWDKAYEDGKEKRVLNRKETAIAQGKQEIIRQKFADWIWADPDRRERLCSLYNDRFNSLRPREYDGAHLTFPGMNPEVRLRKHQVDAIARVLYGGNALLAHVVGAGKTYEMVAAAMESKRLGLANKNLIVVPNHLTEQWASEFLQLYPSANILVATKKDFETRNRKKFCARIATGDYDAIIIGHSQFERIPMSVKRQERMIEQQIDEVAGGISELKRSDGERYSVKQLERVKKGLETRLKKLHDTSRKDDVVTFEELGVDRLFVDEAHFYKNLFFVTKMRNVGGIAQVEAQKSSDLFMKCRYLDEQKDGRSTVFATGTPISNSMVELYTMQRYLQFSELEKRGLHHFDAWASTFGETVTAIELAPEGTKYRAKTRFARFYNLPELMSMFKLTADVQTADMLNLPVPKANFHTVVLSPSQWQKDMVAELAQRADAIRRGNIDPSVDNMLKVTNDGRKLALDQRLINDMLPDDPEGKVAKCADNVFRIWEENAAERLTQLVFCDLSTPNADKFNVYADMKAKLIAKGIPAEEIAFIHDASSEAQKKEMFAKVRRGQIRVLLGSTTKMGAGTNVQDKLSAIHDLDCPWRPADDGRALRTIHRERTLWRGTLSVWIR